jgi:hypothetical protein
MSDIECKNTNTTLLDDLDDEEVAIEPTITTYKLKKMDKVSLSELTTDLSSQIVTRIKAVELYYKLYGESECVELINKLSTMYQFSASASLEEYLYQICTACNISSILKVPPAMSLCSIKRAIKKDKDDKQDERCNEDKKNKGFIAIDYVCQNMNLEKGHINEVPTPVQLELICTLMASDEYKKKSRDYFCSITNNDSLECAFRYKSILSLENKDLTELPYFLKESLLEFFNNKNNMTLYRVLSGQFLLQRNITKGNKHIELTIRQKNNIENIIMSFAQDEDLDYNLRADSADVILRIGSDKNKVLAKEIIMILGCVEKKVNTIFNNAQNVHTDEIEDSVMEALEFLASINMKTLSGKPSGPPITFEYVKKQIDDMLELDAKKLKSSREKAKHKDIVDKIKVSMNRICVDRALYSKYNCTILHILLKIWTYITSHESEKEMKKRLLEELAESAGLCSSGYCSRLINVISGFGQFNLRISFRDQIIANFNGRLNARARDIQNPDKINEHLELYEIKDEKALTEFAENVVVEMAISSSDYENRKNFLKFFRKNMLSIREELYEEFKEYMNDTDFDLYSLSAVCMYENGE